MKTLYLDCGMGAAGDMLTAALSELLPDQDAFFEEMNALGIPGVHFEKEKTQKCGITGTHSKVTVNGEEEEGIDVHDHFHSHEHDHVYEDHTHNHESHKHDNEDHDQVHLHGEHAHIHEDHDHNHTHEDHEHSHEHDHAHHHHHSSMHDVEHIVRDHLPVSNRVKDDVMAVYQLIAEAESVAHGVPVEQIHFHEVGAMDAIADVTAVCVLMEKLSPEQVIVSPVHVGSGKVRCAHGILPVPAPATAYILRDVPIYGGKIQGELCTPTGAALLKHFATKFGDMPVMKTKAIGYGMGKKDFEAANCVRALIGETPDDVSRVSELCCNVDDMTAEEIAFATETILAAGALEVFTVSTGMKKSRPGILLEVMCREEDRDRMLELIFLHTTTLGVREQFSRRYIMKRSIETVKTPYGDVRKKVSTGYGTKHAKYEYEDLATIAREKGMSLREVRQVAQDSDQ